MAIVSYTIVRGAAPFTAQLTPSSIPENIHNTTGTFEFIDVANGDYAIVVTDSNGCTFRQEITVDPLVTTTTTTLIPQDSIVVGNTQDANYIFNVVGTNRDSHYDNGGNPITLYLWLKTLDGMALTTEKLINYSFNAGTDLSSNKFIIIGLSDEVHANVIPNVVGPARNISGSIRLKVGFIESFVQYTYTKDVDYPSFNLELSSGSNWLDPNIPLIDETNQYGVDEIDRDNVIMYF